MRVMYFGFFGFLGIFGILYLFFRPLAPELETGKKKKRKKKAKVVKDTQVVKQVVDLDYKTVDTLEDNVEPNVEPESQTRKFFERETMVEEDREMRETQQEDEQGRQRRILVIKPRTSESKVKMSTGRKKMEENSLTKKQKQNLRKKEIEKAIKSENEIMQKKRLEKYRREQEKEALKKLK